MTRPNGIVAAVPISINAQFFGADPAPARAFIELLDSVVRLSSTNFNFDPKTKAAQITFPKGIKFSPLANGDRTKVFTAHLVAQTTQTPLETEQGIITGGIQSEDDMESLAKARVKHVQPSCHHRAASGSNGIYAGANRLISIVSVLGPAPSMYVNSMARKKASYGN